MKDYLWDKTGSDPAIEALEHDLSEFRASGELPAGIKSARPNQKTPFWKRFHLAAAVPSFAAVLIAAVWFLQPGPAPLPELTDDLALGSEIRTISPLQPAPVIAESSFAPEVTAERPRRSLKRKRTIKINYRKPRKGAIRAGKQTTTAASEPVLTAEEKHAYSQLMRALAITSSKLQLVKEKAVGPEYPQGSK